MNKEEFRYNIARMGKLEYLEEIEDLIDHTEICVSISERRDAAYWYICVSNDHRKLKWFLVTCDNLSRSYPISWDDCVRNICNVIIGWAP